MSAVHCLADRPGPQVGDVLGDRYRLEEALGTGGTADVFRAADLRLRREVAVKVFRPGATAVSADRFGEEAVLLARLAHPALVAVYDAGRYVGGAYVVVQLVNGVTLRERISRARLAGAQVAELGSQLASALAHAHAAGIVHRDVKPSNILIGPGDAPYLADFGISRLIDEPTRAEPGTVVGSVPYLAPEQILGRGSSPASDVYALGLVLLEALKGEREYQGAPLEAGPARLFRSPEIPRWLPAGLASAIELMTRREPAERPDALHCVQLLQRAAEFSSPGAVYDADTSTHRSTKAVQHEPGRKQSRRTVLAGLTAAVVLAATGATLLAMDDGAPTPDAGTRPHVPASAPGNRSGTTPASTEPVGTPLAPVNASRRAVAHPPGTTPAPDRGDPAAEAPGKIPGPPADTGKGKGGGKHKGKISDKPGKPRK